MPTHHHATGNLVAGSARVSIASDAVQFLDRARGLHDGMRALAEDGKDLSQAATFLGSWCLELALKAYLASRGQGKKELRPIQHNLIELWKKAGSLGLAIPTAPPQWCELLSTTHNEPYHQRYPTDAAGSRTPNLSLASTELEALLSAIGSSIQ